MGLDRGDRESVVVVKDDRSKDYISSINAKIASLKNEESEIKSRIAKLVEDFNSSDRQYSSDLIIKQQKVSDVSNEILVASKKLSEINSQIDEKVSVLNDELNRIELRRKDVDKSIADKLSALSAKEIEIKNNLSLLSNEVDNRNSEIRRLNSEIDSLKALNSSLLGMNAELDGKKRASEIAIEEARKVIPEIENELSQKKDEVKKVSDSTKVLAEDRNRIKNELLALQGEKDQIAIDRDKNTKRARELADMANELKIESIALANKNAYLAKREAILKDAQTKVGG